MYFAIDEESEFHQRLNPVAMAKRQIPNGYKNTTKSLTDMIKTKPVSESEDYIDIDEEYLFDEDKNTKNEVNDINILLSKMNINKYLSPLYEELYEESDFIYFVMELVRDEEAIASLLSGENQTVILKAMTLLKSMGSLTPEYKATGLANITDENIKSVALAL